MFSEVWGMGHIMFRKQLVLLVSSVHGSHRHALLNSNSKVPSTFVGGSSQADRLKINYAIDDSIGGS